MLAPDLIYLEDKQRFWLGELGCEDGGGEMVGGFMEEKGGRRCGCEHRQA